MTAAKRETVSPTDEAGTTTRQNTREGPGQKDVAEMTKAFARSCSIEEELDLIAKEATGASRLANASMSQLLSWYRLLADEYDRQLRFIREIAEGSPKTMV
jgi:hypothetical protein